MKNVRFLAATAIVLTWSAPANAYEGYPLHPVHEAMTRQAYACTDRWARQGTTEGDCRTEAGVLSQASSLRLLRNFTAREKAASWSDDPVREITPSSIVRYGWAIKYGCGRAAAAQGSNYTIDRAGLMCSSHFGKLQFFHAMRSSASEQPLETREKMIAWASLTYGIASGAISPDESYCDFLSQVPYAAIRDDLAPSVCQSRIVNGRRLGDWTLATLFTLRCANAFNANSCGVLTDRSGSARSAARGALLHMVQDSFSQSHAVRGGPMEPPFEAKIECLAATAYLFYDFDSAKGHSAADQPPALASTCRAGSNIDDAVTASARVIWMVEHGTSQGDFDRYFAQRVLGA